MAWRAWRARRGMRTATDAPSKTSTATFTLGALARGKIFADAMGVVPAALSVPASGEVTVSLPAQSAAVFVVR